MNWFFILITLFVSQVSTCQIRIDHVIAVVSDLEATKKMYSTVGFSIKEGRLHENGLLNAHIKFANGSSLELMTIHNATNDELAKQYQSLLAEGEGGVYLGLTGHRHDSLKVLFTKMEIEFIETKGRLWSYLTFPPDSYSAHLFFIDYHFDTSSLKDPTHHLNGLNAIQSVEIEGEEKLHRFLEGLGLSMSTSNSIDTATGKICVVPANVLDKRPRILSITFQGENQSHLSFNWRE